MEDRPIEHFLLLTFLCGPVLCSLQVPSLFAVSFLEPWLDYVVCTLQFQVKVDKLESLNGLCYTAQNSICKSWVMKECASTS